MHVLCSAQTHLGERCGTINEPWRDKCTNSRI